MAEPAADQGLSIQVCPGGRSVNLVLAGEVDMASAPKLWSCLDNLGSEWEKVRVDMARVAFVDSSGIATLIRAHQELEGRQQVLELHNLRPFLARLLEIAGVDQLLTGA